MTVELRPLGVNCNIACQYCYQNMHRDAGQKAKSYDLNKMKAAIEEIGGPFHLFGGEPLLVPENDLEDLWAWGLEKYGENGLQTNGVLLNLNHIRMIKQYNVRVGLSIDGPGALNDARWAGSVEKTREATRKSEEAIELLVNNEIFPGMMIQLNKCNSSSERIPLFVDWLKYLDSLKIQTARLHILEIENESIRKKYGLSSDENYQIFKLCGELETKLQSLKFDVYEDQRQMLLMRDEQVTCTWRGCDAYYTDAVHGVDGSGDQHNCGLTDKEGINFQKPEKQSYERYLMLYQVPDEFGGCQGCRFFLACKGQCPGTGIERDWRNKTENCFVWKSLFEIAEKRLLEQGYTPISKHPKRLEAEQAMCQAWEKGENPTLSALSQELDLNLVNNKIKHTLKFAFWQDT